MFKSFQVRFKRKFVQCLIITCISVAMSIVASWFSGVALLGTSTEIYVYGTQYSFILIGILVMGIFMHFVVIPVFYDLQVVSMFEVIFLLLS